MKRKLIVGALGLFLLALMAFNYKAIPLYKINQQSPVQEVIVKLGGDPILHQPVFSIKGVSAEKGREIVTLGITSKPGSGKTSKQSKHFVCTSCHNIQREDPDLSVSDPQARLEYAAKNNLPFLQGTTLYGIVNRTSFYNGDYEKKYGDLVKKARNDIREAIQVCAVECSQGRELKDWELESVLAYLWTLELRLEDLNLSEQELQKITDQVASGNRSEELVELLQRKYLKGSPATFLKPPKDIKAGYEGVEKGDPKNGKLIYDLGCKYCHENKRYSFFPLDDAKGTFKHLKSNIAKYNRYSIYQVGRYGTYPINGKKAYMPNYTEEKMSNQQMEDLRAYIEQAAKR